MGKVKYLPIILCIFFSIIISGAIAARKLSDRADRARLVALQGEVNKNDRKIIELLETKLKLRKNELRILEDIRIGRAIMRLTGKKAKIKIKTEDILRWM